MNLAEQISKQIREVYFGGNWTDSNLKQHVSDLNWQQSAAKLYSFNTIASLVYHMNYYVAAVLKVLQGAPLDASDKYSFGCPPIESPEDWENLLNKTWAEADQFAQMIEQLPEARLWEPFSDGKYGNYYRNILGVIEHIHYHLGQIVLIKKLILQSSLKTD